MMTHPSDSAEQREAEPELIEALSRELGISLAPAILPLGNGAQVAVDGLNLEARVACEVYAHIGETKGAQRHKIARDILKLLAVERIRGGGQWRKMLCFADGATAQCLLGRSWLAEVCRTLDIEIHVLPLSSELRAKILAAQRRQVMVNPT